MRVIYIASKNVKQTHMRPDDRQILKGSVIETNNGDSDG